MSITLSALSGLLLHLETQTLNTTACADKSCRSVSCPESIFMRLSSSSKVSFHFLTTTPVGFSTSPNLAKSSAGCRLFLTSRIAERFPEYLRGRLIRADPPLPFQTPPEPAEKTASLTQCQQEASWVATLARTDSGHSMSI